MTKITVVIPTCDRLDFLTETVQCVLDQSRPADEIVVVNNGEFPLPQDYLPENIKVLELSPYVGVSCARNEGVNAAMGDYIAFLDDDDLWERDYLRKVEEFIVLSDGVDCFVTRVDMLIDGQIKEYKNAKGLINLSVLFERNPGIGGQSTVIKKSVFLSINGYNTTLKTGEDKALIIDLLIKGYKVHAATHIQAIQRTHFRPRLTDPKFMYQGISAFLNTYKSNMGYSLYIYNKVKIYFYKSMFTKNNYDLCKYLFYYHLYKIIRKVIGKSLPHPPRLAKENLKS